MNEVEWSICARPDLMLVHLQRHFDFRLLRRKLRLFICACRRLGWKLNKVVDERAAIEAAEGFADGLVPHAERDAAKQKLAFDYLRYRLLPDNPRDRLILGRLIPDHFKGSPPSPRLLAILACETDNRLGDGAQQAAACLVRAWTEAALGPNASGRPGSEWKQWQAKHRRSVSYYLRDIFGNPFRTISADSRWLEWNDRTLPKLAQAIYDEFAFDRLPILADALEEAGCTDPDIFDHCRQPGEHVRGCWVVDLLLGKS